METVVWIGGWVVGGHPGEGGGAEAEGWDGLWEGDMGDNEQGELYWRWLQFSRDLPGWFEFTGDGEKCKSVNLRCGEKVFGQKMGEETGRGQDPDERVGGGAKGKPVSKHLLRDPVRYWISG